MSWDEKGWMFNGQPDMAEQAQRIMDLKGDLPLRLVDPHLSVGIQLDDWSRPEYRYPRRRVMFQQLRTAAVVAAQFPQVGLVGPSFGRPLAWVKRITIQNLLAAPFGLGFAVQFAGPGGLAAGTVGFPVDDRARGVVSAFTINSGNSAAAHLNTASQGVRQILVPASSSVVLDNLEIILTAMPNVGGGFTSNLFLEGNVLGGSFAASIEWEERAMVTSELT